METKVPSKEGLKELLRLSLFAAVAAIITLLLNTGVEVLLVGWTLDPVFKGYLVAAITAMLKAADKWLHEQGKLDGSNSKGLVGF